MKDAHPFFVKGDSMPQPRSTRPAKARKDFVLQKPNGGTSDHASNRVGPEHFGIVAVDCATVRSRYFLADFYGRVVLEPTTLSHSRGDLQPADNLVNCNHYFRARAQQQVGVRLSCTTLASR